MDDRLSRLEEEVERLASALARIDARLSALEVERRAVFRSAETVPSTPAAPLVVSDSEIARGITLAGRTLLILGGGYLLRALTEAEALAPLAGASLGILYALLWLVLADRAGANAHTMSAAFFGGAAVLVAFPLLWETTARFQLLSPSAGAALVALVSLVAIAVAWRHRLRSFAWVTVVGATITSVALVFGTRQLAPFSLLLVMLGVATLWLAYHAGWPVVHWIVAGVADLTVLGLIAGVAIESSGVAPLAAAGVGLALFAAFWASFIVRIVAHGAEPGPFEILQGGAATLVGYGGALLATGDGAAELVLGALAIALGGGAYGLSLSGRARSPESSSYFEAQGCLLLLLGGYGLFREPTLFFALAGLALVGWGSRAGRAMLGLHGALLIVASAISSGLLVQVAYALGAPTAEGWPPITAWMLVASLGAAVAYGLYRVTGDEDWTARWRLGNVLLLTTLVLALGGLALAAMVPTLTRDVAELATLRTAVLALSALGLGWLARSSRCREAAWLVYPVLLLGGIKLLIEDFPRGRAVTLFVALALYGGALILAPRVSRQTQ